MLKNLRLLLLNLFFLPAIASADVPDVVTDISPIYSLAAKVMDGIGEPKLIVQHGASPHEYMLRPSNAKALESADIVFFVGGGLTPWLENPLKNLASQSIIVELMETKNTTRLAYREGANFASHEGHNHGDHDDDHEGHDDDHDSHKGHDDDHEELDPHGWLDPENGKNWLDIMATTLAKIDPENANKYQQNAAKGKKEIDESISQIETMLKPVSDMRFIVFHDAYYYFEDRFGLSATGSISLGDASDPSPGRLIEIQDEIKRLTVSCVFSEPQFNPQTVQNVASGAAIDTRVIDPLGSALQVNSDLYTKLLEDIGKSIASCHDH
jgi:zinc transport system substrate-binding protein